jgi:hypothetical protein
LNFPQEILANKKQRYSFSSPKLIPRWRQGRKINEKEMFWGRKNCRARSLTPAHAQMGVRN